MRNSSIYKLALFLCISFCFVKPFMVEAQERLLPTAEVEHLSLEKMLETADVTFEGKVIDQHTFKHGGIFTAHRVEVYKVFKGNIKEPFVEVITIGGGFGNEAMEISHGNLEIGVGSTGIFTGNLTKYIDSTSTVPETLRFNAHLGNEGFIMYDPIYKTGISAYKMYENISPYLYDKISQIIGNQPTIIKEFNIDKWNFLQDKREAAEKEALKKTKLKQKKKLKK